MRLSQISSKHFQHTSPGELIVISRPSSLIPAIAIVATVDNNQKAVVYLPDKSESANGAALYIGPARFNRQIISYGMDFHFNIDPNTKFLFGPDKNLAKGGYLVVLDNQYYMSVSPYPDTHGDDMYLDLNNFDMINFLPRSEDAVYIQNWSINLAGTRPDEEFKLYSY